VKICPVTMRYKVRSSR